MPDVPELVIPADVSGLPADGIVLSVAAINGAKVDPSGGLYVEDVVVHFITAVGGGGEITMPARGQQLRVGQRIRVKSEVRDA